MKLKHPDVKRLLLKGLTPREIMSELGVSRYYVDKWRRQLGMPGFRRGCPKGFRPHIKERADVAIRMKEAGFSYREIGETLGVSKQRAQQYCRPPNWEDMSKFGTCPKCGKKNVVLHIHHKRYLAQKTAPLCNSCHMFHHGLEGMKDRLKRLKAGITSI